MPSTKSATRPRINNRGKDGAGFPQGKSGNPTGASDKQERVDDLWTAMSHVVTSYRNETRQHVELRHWLREDRKGFMARYIELERANLPRAQGPTGTSVQVDESEETLRGLIRKLQAAFEDER